MLNVEKTYIIHYTKLQERKTHIDNLLSKYGVTNYEYIREFDKDSLTEEDISSSYIISEDYYSKTLAKVYPDTHFRQMHLGEVSCVFKHRLALSKIGAECKEFGFIIEDDIITEEDFDKHFNNFLSKTPDDWDAIFMGSCCGLNVSGNKDFNADEVAYFKSHPATRCADAYLIKKDMARKIHNSMSNFVIAYDWELAYHLYLHNAKVYWWEPSLIAQGSERGLFRSSLR